MFKMKSRFILILLTIIFESIVAPPARVPKNNTEESVDRIPEPEFWHYTRKIVSIFENNDLHKKLGTIIKQLDKDLGKDWFRSKKASKELTKFIDEHFSPDVQKELNKAKKSEVDRIRRKFLARKKDVEYKDELGYLHVDNIKEAKSIFGVEDILSMVIANSEHYAKYEKMREKDFKRYEMEKKFLAEQKAKHIRDDQKRKQFLEQIEKERAEYAAAKKKEKAPLTKEEIKEVWKDKDELPEDEFNAKTFFALHDIDGDGALDLDEVRMLVANEVNKTFSGTHIDEREKLEEIEKMTDHIYKKIDKNRDLLIEFDEFIQRVENDEDYDYEHDDDWKDPDDRDDIVYDDEEFDTFEKERINDIRDDFANGEKPDGYEFDDVPLLDGNFVNETLVKVGNLALVAKKISHNQRMEAFKKHEMEKKFEKEEEIIDQDKLSASEKDKLQQVLDEKYYNQKEDDIKFNKPLSPEQLETVWEEQDHKTKEEFNPTKLFRLHDVNQDGFLDEMELRMMLITEVQKHADPDDDDEEKEEYLEEMLEDVLDEADTNNDNKISMDEFLKGEQTREEESKRMKDDDKARKEDNEKYWTKLHSETQFTAEEYRVFREQRVLEIRKMIADGIIPQNYNYSHVPLLQGNFINASHIQRGSDLISIHDQDDEQRKEDFKKFKMAKRFEYEHKLSKMTPEEREDRIAKDKKRHEEQKKRLDNINDPLSEKQIKEVWEEEDRMEKDAYSDDKFFRLHDFNEDGKWDRQEVRQILLRELAKAYDEKYELEEIEDEKYETLERWREEVFKFADANKDGFIQKDEFLRAKNSMQSTHWKKKMQEISEYTDEEYEKYKMKKE